MNALMHIRSNLTSAELALRQARAHHRKEIQLRDRLIAEARANSRREQELYRELRFGMLRSLGIPVEQAVRGSLIVERRDDELIISWSEMLTGDDGKRFLVRDHDGGRTFAKREMQGTYRLLRTDVTEPGKVLVA